MDRATARYGITVPDRELACTPVDSPEGLEREDVAVRPKSLRSGGDPGDVQGREVVAASESAGLCRTVARLFPLGVAKE
jgi:RNA-splicing ligase RtcB